MKKIDEKRFTVIQIYQVTFLVEVTCKQLQS